ncbi:MAG: M48 family metalloprotease [Proteobacteria bacterium]|nr:M48 family metalloprotease [Pseudomonadota bacterium]
MPGASRRIASCVAFTCIALLSSYGPGVRAAELLIPPGYLPAADAKMDERGIWMEMDEAEQALKRSPLVVRDDTITDYVEDVVCRVAGEYCPDVRVYVMRNPYFNASMAPNGTMLIHTGLLVRMTSSDQLASIVGHELAHYTQKHSLRGLRAAKRRMTAGMLVSMGLAVGGVSSGGLPELIALASVMGFTRAQEAEADLLGVGFMEGSGYDPHASYAVWLHLEQEEANASVKRPKGPVFLSSHPAPDARAARLANAAEQLSEGLETRNDASAPPELLVTMVQRNYASLLDEQVRQGDFGRLSTLLDRHEAIGIRSADVAFYRGESWRVRKGAGDHEHAIKAYETALSYDVINPRAHRELGYLLYKYSNSDQAAVHFRTYLEHEPDASDRAMIQFYIDGGWQ